MKSEYQAIRGVGTGRRSLRVGVRCRVYQGTDHLLLIQSTGYTEEYKRIFYRNIRYVVARRTAGRSIQAVVAGLLFMAVWLLHLTPLHSGIIFILSLPFLVWFVMNLVLGPACRVYVSTDIQTLELPAPRRVKKMPVLLAFLRGRTESPPSSVRN